MLSVQYLMSLALFVFLVSAFCIMTDPFSIAAGVAGLVALAGTTSKTFYRFFRSIYDAPDAARNLATALYTLNVALSQIQQSLLDPKFVRVGDDDQITAIEDCLASCTAAFDTIRARIEASGLASNEQTFPKKTWEAVKASFSEKQMKDCLDRIEREKTTLTLIVGVFSMLATRSSPACYYVTEIASGGSMLELWRMSRRRRH